jgi:hypothetical protein
VVEAYDRMVAEGVIEAVPKSGFYVARLAATPKGPAQNAPQRLPEIDPFWVSRQSLDADADTDKPGCGWLPPDWMPQDALRRALRVAAQDSGLITLYGSTRGEPSLRRQLALSMAAEGLSVHPDQVLLTGSGTQAIDLICRLMIKPGDAVLLDDPCYFNFQALLAAHKARVVSVPYGPDGPDPEQFEAIVARERPRLYLTNSALHNPTGASLSPQVAHRLPAIAAAHGMVIVEDDIFADFAPQTPRMAVLDGLHSIIRIGSFSKTLSASLRCGYIVARGLDRRAMRSSGRHQFWRAESLVGGGHRACSGGRAISQTYRGVASASGRCAWRFGGATGGDGAACPGQSGGRVLSLGRNAAGDRRRDAGTGMSRAALYWPPAMCSAPARARAPICALTRRRHRRAPCRSSGRKSQGSRI